MVSRVLLFVILALVGCAAPPSDWEGESGSTSSCLCLVCGEAVLCRERGSALVITHVCSVADAPVSVLVQQD